MGVVALVVVGAVVVGSLSLVVVVLSAGAEAVAVAVDDAPATSDGAFASSAFRLSDGIGFEEDLSSITIVTMEVMLWINDSQWWEGIEGDEKLMVT